MYETHDQIIHFIENAVLARPCRMIVLSTECIATKTHQAQPMSFLPHAIIPSPHNNFYTEI